MFKSTFLKLKGFYSKDTQTICRDISNPSLATLAVLNRWLYLTIRHIVIPGGIPVLVSLLFSPIVTLITCIVYAIYLICRHVIVAEYKRGYPYPW